MILSSKYYISETYQLFNVLVTCKFSCKVLAINRHSSRSEDKFSYRKQPMSRNIIFWGLVCIDWFATILAFLVYSNLLKLDLFRKLKELITWVGKGVINLNYYNSNLIRSAGSRQVDRHGSPDQTRLDLVIRACQRDVIRHFWSSYCYNDKFIIYRSHIIKKLK